MPGVTDPERLAGPTLPLDREQTLQAVTSFVGRSTGAIIVGPEHAHGEWISVRFHEGALEVAMPARGRWLRPSTALMVRGRDRVYLLWDRSERSAAREVTLSLVRLVGERRAERVLDELEAAA